MGEIKKTYIKRYEKSDTDIEIVEMELAIIFSLIAFTSAGNIFQISFDQLNSIASSGESELLHDVFREDGALVVSSLPPEYAEAVRGLKTHGPKCLENNSLPVFDLPDGSQRRTFALDSDTRTEYPDCVEEESNTIHQYFDHLDTVMSAVILDVIGDLGKTEWTTEDSQGGNILDKVYKEHIHVYTNHEEQGTDYAVPFHTDNGLMLFLTPFQEHPLVIRNRREEHLDLSHIGDDSVIVIIGSALPNWLVKGLTCCCCVSVNVNH